MASPSLAEAVLTAIGELEIEIQKMNRRIPGAQPEEFFRCYRIFGRLEHLAQARISESSYEAIRRDRQALNPNTNLGGASE